MAAVDVRSPGSGPNLDALGISYVILAVGYSFFVAGELALLFRYRAAFCVRLRGFHVVLAAVALLHVYLVLVLLVYPENGAFPCAAEYWVMSIFLPFGMALFQACNARVLRAYDGQRRLRRDFVAAARRTRLARTPAGLARAWLALDASAKVHLAAVVGLVASFVPALVLFCSSRRFHAAFGAFGPVAGDAECRRGGEWVPSILIQLFWTAVVGPWILWRIRNVHDVHYWAWQTRLTIVAGFPGTPLWLAFTYSRSPGMLRVNQFFVPAGWFLPGLVVCQQVLLMVPLCDVVGPPRRSAATLRSASSASDPPRRRELKPKASMQSLDVTIAHNIEPLIAWAAAREFTAENAIFLREVRNFRRKWAGLPAAATPAQRRHMFAEASLVFFALVHPTTAAAPINIEYKVFRALQRTFAAVEYDPYPAARAATPESAARDHVVCPWEDVLDRPPSLHSLASSASAGSAGSAAHVPADFSDAVFDAAYESIKYLVFTNTWPRFVEAQLAGEALATT